MPEYELRAELDGVVRVESVYGDAANMDEKIVSLFVRPDAEEWEVADADASMAAIPRVLNLACDDPVWARGRITLTNLRTGRIVREMPEKEETP